VYRKLSAGTSNADCCYGGGGGGLLFASLQTASFSVRAEIRARKEDGIEFDANILELDENQIIFRFLEDGGPVIVVVYMVQQINCIRKKGEIVEVSCMVECGWWVLCGCRAAGEGARGMTKPLNTLSIFYVRTEYACLTKKTPSALPTRRPTPFGFVFLAPPHIVIPSWPCLFAPGR
jgi:hypothetical protein